MFKQLRNKFLFLNLIIISVMMLIAFTAIYLITYNNVYRETERELHRLSEINRREEENPKQSPPFRDNGGGPPNRSLSFSLLINREHRLLAVSSIFNMENEFYEEAKEAVLSQTNMMGTLKLDGIHWAFMVKPHFDGYRIFFLDVSNQRSFLTNLIYTFLLVALIMLIFIFFISRFFANRSIQPIQEAFDKQKQFIADASHELKTPLAVIHTNVDVLLSNRHESIESQSKWLYYIKSETERMSKLTQDLLYLAQVDYSDDKMIFTSFDFSEIVENVILTMEAFIFENDISLDYDIAPHIFITGNKEQIQQVVMILLDNALKYTKNKGTVNISLKRQHPILLSVTNTGEGIPESDLDKIFDRFYRIDKSRTRKEGGYGLGLAIAKVIIQQHGGKIFAKSSLNESTTFFVELPFKNTV